MYYAQPEYVVNMTKSLHYIHHCWYSNIQNGSLVAPLTLTLQIDSIKIKDIH